MSLGEKLRQARLETGLSQRALCGEEITRNMLSLIENGAAQPSMRTLQYLADQLGKPISFFLDESGVMSENHAVMEAARRFYDNGQYAAAREALRDYLAPDAVYDREWALLRVLTELEFARQAIADRRDLYARTLLEAIDTEGLYCAEALERRRILLLGQLPGSAGLSGRLPSIDDELMLRARESLLAGDARRGAQLLEAMEGKDSSSFQLLRGDSFLAQEDYRHAAECYHLAEAQLPEAVIPKLELCYREMGDFKQAYFYACKQKK